jgi:hypothetical protein
MREELKNRVLNGLYHPVSLLAILLVVLNDGWLKTTYPSWWTGKLSDVGMVVLIPWITIFFLTLVFPKRWLKIVPILGFSLPVIVFGLGKTLPLLNSLVYQIMAFIFPFRVHFVLDPSDLLSFLFLPISVFVWRQTTVTAPVRSWRWLLVPVVCLVGLGDAAAPEYGIVCVTADQDGTWAKSMYFEEVYFSTDGGLNWVEQPYDTNYPADCELGSTEVGEVTLFTDQENKQWRFTSGESIAFSDDGGKTWQQVLNLTQLSQAELAFRHQQQSNFEFVHGPLDIIQDPGTGNLIAAMGQEGILVHRASDGQWVWVALGDYAPQTSLLEAGFGSVVQLLLAEILLSVFFGVFLVSLYNLTINRRWWRIVKVVLAFLGWSAVMLFSPAVTDAYIRSSLWVIGIPAAGIWALVCLVDDIVSWIKNPKTNWKWMVVMGLAASVLMIVIFVLWGLNVLFLYSTALVFIFLLSLIMGIGGTIWAQTRNRVEEENYAQP